MQDIVLITSLSLPSIHSYLIRGIKDALHEFLNATRGLDLAPFFKVEGQQEAEASYSLAGRLFSKKVFYVGFSHSFALLHFIFFIILGKK